MSLQQFLIEKEGAAEHERQPLLYRSIPRAAGTHARHHTHTFTSTTGATSGTSRLSLTQKTGFLSSPMDEAADHRQHQSGSLSPDDERDHAHGEYNLNPEDRRSPSRHTLQNENYSEDHQQQLPASGISRTTRSTSITRRRNFGRPAGRGVHFRYRPGQRQRDAEAGRAADLLKKIPFADAELRTKCRSRGRHVEFLQLQNELLRSQNWRLLAHVPITDYKQRTAYWHPTAERSDHILRAWVAHARPEEWARKTDDAVFATEKYNLKGHYQRHPQGTNPARLRRTGHAPDFDHVHTQDRHRTHQERQTLKRSATVAQPFSFWRRT